MVQGNKKVWSGFGQKINVGAAISSPVPGIRATLEFSLIFGSDCNNPYDMGNLIGFGFQIGGEFTTDQGKSYLCRTNGITFSTDSYLSREGKLPLAQLVNSIVYLSLETMD